MALLRGDELKFRISFILAMICASFGFSHSSPVKPNFTFAVVGDRTGRANDEIFYQVISDLDFIQPDLVFTVGDHVEGYSTDSLAVCDEWDRVLAELRSTGKPCFCTPGNHDIWDETSREIFREKAGPADTAFSYQGCLFVILDVSMDYTAERLPQERLTWLEEHLKMAGKGRKFVFYHKPFWCEDFSKNATNKLHEIFKHYGVTAVFTGHYHIYFESRVDGISYYCVPSSGGGLPGWALPQSTFYGYFLVRVRPDTVIARPFEVGISRHEVVTFDDMMRFNSLKSRMIKIDEIEPVINGHIDEAAVKVTIENVTSSILEDTLVWSLPQPWRVEPPKDYIEIPSGEIATLNALVSCQGQLFPAPSLKMCFSDEGSNLCLVKPLKVRRQVVAPVSQGVVEIDGTLGDNEWKYAGLITHLYNFENRGVKSDSTRILVLHDSSRLYIAFECFDSDPPRLKAGQSERDGFGGSDDRVTLLLEPERGKTIFYEISFNPKGVVSDRMIEICPFGSYVMHPEWDASLRVEGKITDWGYLLECSIPLADIGISSANVPAMGLNLARWHSGSGLFEAFQLPYRYDPDRLGILVVR